MIAFSDLIKPATRAEVQAKIYELLGDVGISTTSWKPGGVTRTIIVVFSAVLAALTVLISQIAQAGFLELSSGNWLTQVAYYIFGERRFAATFATGYVTLTNGGGGEFVVEAEDLIVTAPRIGKSYRNIAEFTLSAGQSVTIAVQALEIGADSSALPGDISRLETTLLEVTVTNEAAVLGTNEESDTSLKARCLAKLGARSPNGPADAYAFAARSALRADGSAIGVTRVAHSKDGFGNLTVYVATPSGGVTGTVTDLTSDLGIIHDRIQKNATPLAVTEFTASAAPVEIPVVGEAWIYTTANLTPDQARERIEAAHVDFISKQPISGNLLPGEAGGKVFRDQIAAVLGTAIPKYQMVHSVFSSPASDVSIDVGEVPVPGDVTLTIHLVDPPAASS